MTTNTNPPANTLPIGAGDREADLPPGSASRTLMTWQPIETAPKDRPIWGKVGDNAIRMFWHEKFDAFISRFNRMTMAPGYLINGEPYEDHSPEYVDAKWWMPLPSPPNRGEK
ncbi:hypothetical protein [Roseixanthobacter glucoisosaccharinicivorans]|uniref:hypothetical protein n=1 Tax=Roseixanthobacter glucoisosaccharinicivorans TaxID=3119923 RepID=UPI0037278CBD